MNAADEDRIFTKSFFLIFTALLCTALVMYVLMSSVTEYATSMGSTAAIAGLVSGIYIFGGLCSRIYSGGALNRIGWKKTALIFMSVHFLSCFLYLIVDDVTIFLIVRFVHGIGFGASANAIVTIASAILPQKRFGEAFGYFMLGTTLAVGLGPFIGGLVYDGAGANGCFLMAGLFSAVALISMFFIKVDEPEGETAGTVYTGIERIFEVGAIPVSFFTALTSLGYVSILSFYRLFAFEVNLSGAFSWFFIIYSLCLVVLRPVAGRIQDNGGDLIVCTVGIIAQAAGLFLIAVMPSNVTVTVCAICLALGFGTLNSACTTIVTRNVSERRRPYAVSTFFIFCDAAMGFGPALLGSFASAGYAQLYLISSIVTLTALPVCVYSLRNNFQA